MRRWLIRLAVGTALFSAGLFLPAQTPVPFTATKIVDSTGAPLASGNICFPDAASCIPVTNGAVSKTATVVPGTGALTLKDSTGLVVFQTPATIAISGPFSFDTFVIPSTMNVNIAGGARGACMVGATETRTDVTPNTNATCISINGVAVWVGNASLSQGLPGVSLPVGGSGGSGAPGAPGAAATVQIGNVTTGTTPSVVNRGTPNAAILDIVLPASTGSGVTLPANVQYLGTDSTGKPVAAPTPTATVALPASAPYLGTDAAGKAVAAPAPTVTLPASITYLGTDGTGKPIAAPAPPTAAPATSTTAGGMLLPSGVTTNLLSASAIYDATKITAMDKASLRGNALANAFGVPINDGAAHLIKNITTAPFAGVTTIAQLRAIRNPVDGTTPFAVLFEGNADGSNAPTMGFVCDGEGHTVNCLTRPDGYYHYTDTDVPNISVTWLAIQAQLATLTAHLPRGSYLVPAPLMYAMAFEGDESTLLTGEGHSQSTLMPDHDFGFDQAVLSAGDPFGNATNGRGAYGNVSTAMLRDFGVQLPGNLGCATIAGPSVQMTGINIAGRTAINHVTVRCLNVGIGVVGDHMKWDHLHTYANMIGIRLRTPFTALTGNLVVSDWQGQDILTSISVAPGAIWYGDIDDQSYMGAGTGFTGEACTATNGPNGSNGCTPIIGDGKINAMAENLIYGFAVDMTGMPGMGGNDGNYHPEKLARGVGNFSNRQFHKFDTSGGKETQFKAAHPTWVRNSAFYVADMFGEITFSGMHDDGGGFSPKTNTGTIEQPISWLYSNKTPTGHIQLEGNMAQFFGNLNGIPFVNQHLGTDVNLNVEFRQPGQFHGFVKPIFGTPNGADLIEGTESPYSGCVAGCHAFNNYGSILGTAFAASSLSGNVVPIVYDGRIGARETFGSTYGPGNNKLTVYEGPELSLLNNGAGYTNGQYTNIPITGGDVTSQPQLRPTLVTVNVAGGTITNYVITQAGDYFYGGGNFGFTMPPAAGTPTTPAVWGTRFPAGRVYIGPNPAPSAPVIGSSTLVFNDATGPVVVTEFKGPIPPK